MYINKRFSLVLLLVFLAATAFAQLSVTLTPTDAGAGYEAVIKALENTLSDELPDIPAIPKNLMQGFADASVFAGHGATQRAFGGYNLFAITVGGMVGVRIPSAISFSDALDPSDVMDKIDENSAFGMGIQGINVELGLHVSRFIPLDNIYAALRFGYLNLDIEDQLNFKTFQIGALGRYQFFDGINLLFFKWRGLTVGTGFIIQKTELGFDFPLGDEVYSETIGLQTVSINDPVATFDMTITTYTIPLEVTTAVQLLIFNLGVGLGADMAFGNNDLSIGMDGRVYSGTTHVANASIDGGGKNGPTFFNPKLMANIGIKLGPVILDVPMTYYFGKDSGLSLGVTLGAVF